LLNRVSKKGKKLTVNCPSSVGINQEIDCTVTAVSLGSNFQIVIDFKDGSPTTNLALTDSTMTVKKIFRQLGTFEINVNVIGEGLNVNPQITVLPYVFAYDGQQIRITCPLNTRVKIVKAFYGKEDENINCVETNAQTTISNFCNNQTNCTIIVYSNPQLTDPCPYKTKYLKMYFTCYENSFTDTVSLQYRTFYEYDVIDYQSYIIATIPLYNELRCLRKCLQSTSCSMVIFRNSICEFYNSNALKFLRRSSTSLKSSQKSSSG
jgi:hypothetical protein